MQLEVDEAFRTLDVPDDKALKAAAALSAALVRIEDETAKDSSKRDADVDSIRKEVVSINLRLATMAGDINLIKWMKGTLTRPALSGWAPSPQRGEGRGPHRSLAFRVLDGSRPCACAGRPAEVA